LPIILNICAVCSENEAIIFSKINQRGVGVISKQKSILEKQWMCDSIKAGVVGVSSEQKYEIFEGRFFCLWKIRLF